MENNQTFEQSLKSLEEIVEQLQKGDIELEKAYSLFEEGMRLSKLCEQKLISIEQKLLKILENGELKDFEVKENES